jgi:hypothetical protein
MSREYQAELSNRFPTGVELCYGKRLPRKVPADLYQVLPAGKRCSVWFTYDKHKGGNTCYLVFEQKGQQTFEQAVACFDNELAYGTVVSGVLISNVKESAPIFCIDSISYYKGVYVRHNNYQKKLNILSKMFNKPEVSNVSADHVLRFAIPILCNSYHDAQAHMGKLPYKTLGVRLLGLKEKDPIGDVTLVPSELEEQTFVFSVKPNQEPDSYSLFGFDKNIGRKRFAGKAIVCSYDQSKKLNSLFRIIRENDDIDLIEESEDEDTFEDISEQKFIKPNVHLKMFCKYNSKFRKWELLSVAPTNMDCSDVLSVEAFTRQTQQNRVFRNHPTKAGRVQGQHHYKKLHRK